MHQKTKENVFWIAAPLLLGLIFGLAIPGSRFLPYAFRKVSSVVGWIYFFDWSLSFYPQLVLNYFRRDVEGLSVDFQLLNAVGFGCYSLYNALLFWSPPIRQAYAKIHEGNPPAVHLNDVVFAFHAFIITLFVFGQCVYYLNGSLRHSISAPSAIFCALVTVITMCWACILCIFSNATIFGMYGWLAWIYFLSYVKLLITLVKYIPQVVLNAQRESTIGWSVWNVVLDAQGGMLSIAQLVLDSIVMHHISSITGNMVKLGLGLISIIFDVILMVQHWILYPEKAPSWPSSTLEEPHGLPSDGSKGDESEPILQQQA